ncbi:hypothetical protein [Sphingomonas sp. R86520]|uniref:hypothetical protein n=1 Tax=Sphingomonas sp. R86520 TaxID=3093859 RepID=UPI0036D3D248
MNTYWIAHLTVWGAAMLYAAPGAYYAAFRQRSARTGDAMRLAVFLVALVMNSHIARWLIAPNDLGSWKAIYFVGFLTGLYVIRLMVSYGRGKPLATAGEDFDHG